MSYSTSGIFMDFHHFSPFEIWESGDVALGLPAFTRTGTGHAEADVDLFSMEINRLTWFSNMVFYGKKYILYTLTCHDQNAE